MVYNLHNSLESVKEMDRLEVLLISITFVNISKCDVIKQNESEVKKYDCWFFDIFY